ncbi:MAG: NUDIX domain-containing protein [Candidatus Micrarchaeota archaeon]|nr:NUDIX domain-containing protein [Candidatus Micrarchaeota archaeon]
MSRLDPQGTVKRLWKKLPKMPTGEMDYSRSNSAVVVSVFVKHKDKVLLVKRSNKVTGFRGKWNAVSGYVDELRPIREIAVKELEEEVRMLRGNIKRVYSGKPYKFIDRGSKRTCIVCPYLVDTKKKPAIRLDWENTSYKWIEPGQITDFDTVPRLEKSLSNALAALPQ